MPSRSWQLRQPSEPFLSSSACADSWSWDCGNCCRAAGVRRYLQAVNTFFWFLWQMVQTFACSRRTTPVLHGVNIVAAGDAGQIVEHVQGVFPVRCLVGLVAGQALFVLVAAG